jgi:VWFA-related protein
MIRPLTALLALIALPLGAQTRSGTPVDARIDVVVTDKAGQHVAGLTKDDFVVTDEGRPQTIASFAHVSAAPRRYVVFIDNDSLQPAVRKQFLAGLRKFVDTRLEGGDRASIVSWNRTLEIAVPLTDDKTVLKAAIDAMEATPPPNSIRTSYSRLMQRCSANVREVSGGRMRPLYAYQDCMNRVRAETSTVIDDSRLLMNAINVAMTVTAGSEGKKGMVLLSASLPAKPGSEMYRWANILYMPVMRGFDWPNEQPSEGDANMQKDMLEKLARSANAHGVALYPIAPLATDVTDIQATTGGLDFGADTLRLENTEAAFATLARMTGGMAVARPADFGAALDSIAGDLRSYYSIGYQPPGAIARDRALTVRAKKGDYTARAKQSYAPKTAEDHMSDRVIANVYSPLTSDLRVTLRAGALKEKAPGTFEVPVEVSLPATLELVQQDGKLAGGFIVYLTVGNKQGALSAVSRSPQEVVVPVAEEAEFRKLPIEFGVNLTLKPGENFVSVAVVDQVSRRAGFARAAIRTP